MEEAVRRGDLEAVVGYIHLGSGDIEWKKLLLVAIKKGYEDIAVALLGAQTLSWEELWAVYDVASDYGTEGMVRELLSGFLHSVRGGADCTGLVQAQLSDLFRYAGRKSDWEAMSNLLKSSCCVSFLSKEEQEALLGHAFNEDHDFVGDMSVVQSLLQNVDVNILSRKQQEMLLICACTSGDLNVVDNLITNGCNVNCSNRRNMYEVEYFYYDNDLTPLMVAVIAGHDKIVKKLILAGAKVGMRSSCYNTALHFAAANNHIQAGILLAEGGASFRTKNKYLVTPLDAAQSAEFVEAINQAASFTTRKTLCIIGNAESGKSTLIAALQAVRSSVFGKIFNHFRRVDDRRKRTAGIETIHHYSQKYGEVLFFDFAGQHEYHGPHQMFLESLLSKPGVSMTLLLVVKATEEEDAILHQLHRWLTPVALMATAASPPQVIVIGSFLDQVKYKHEATAQVTKCIEATRKNLEESPLEIVGSCFLNCRQPQSEGIDQLCQYLEGIPVPEFRATHTQYSLAWVLSQIRSSFKVKAVQLQEFSKWIQDNKHNLSQTMPPPEMVCQDLSAAGHALYLPNKEAPPKGWLVLDLPSILQDVYGTLFSQSEDIANEVGLVHRQHLGSLFQDLDVEFVQQLLVGMEFCIPVDPSVLKVEVSKLTQSKEASGWLFFPALMSVKAPLPSSESLPQHSACFSCWQLMTSKKHSISARVLQTILLRLAANFVVKQRDEEGVQRHCCSIWWNGIAWQSKKGVDVTIRITNNRVIQVLSTSDVSADRSYQSFHYLSDVISDIISVVRQLSPNFAAAAYIVHPWKMAALHEDATTPPPKEMFPVEDIRNSIADNEEYTLSTKDSSGCSTRLPVSDLFGGWIPSLEDIERVLWTQHELSQPQSPAELGKTAYTPASATPTFTPAATDPPPDCSLTASALSVDPLQTSTSPLHSSLLIPLGAQALLDTSAVPTLDDVNELIVTQVAAKWQNLAIKLGVKDFLIDVISKNNRHDCEEACQDMLKRWLREERHTGGEGRTWSTLLTALGRADFGELERDLRREHFHDL